MGHSIKLEQAGTLSDGGGAQGHCDEQQQTAQHVQGLDVHCPEGGAGKPCKDYAVNYRIHDDNNYKYP